MIANALFVATPLFLAVGFLTPWRSFILHHHLHRTALYSVLLFANILGLAI
jgi:hypothetical protein